MRPVTLVTLIVVLVAGLSVGASNSHAAIINQWANTVIDFSSQYDTGDNSANQARFAPDVFAYGDNVLAWAPANWQDSYEYITLGYATPVYATSVTIRETWGTPFVTQVDVLDTGNILHNVWAGTDTSPAETLADFLVSFSQTGYLVKGVKVTLYTGNPPEYVDYKEIDAVKLTGSDTPVPLPGAVWLLGGGLVGLAAFRRRFRR